LDSEKYYRDQLHSCQEALAERNQQLEQSMNDQLKREAFLENTCKERDMILAEFERYREETQEQIEEKDKNQEELIQEKIKPKF
jgi:hypothetical protein